MTVGETPCVGSLAPLYGRDVFESEAIEQQVGVWRDEADKPYAISFISMVAHPSIE